MMDELAAWLKQIVAVVLLAGLIDLMLPNRALQRYVRLVAGLMILLTVAQPVLQFLRGDLSGRLTEAWDRWNALPSPAVSSMDLRRIEAEAEQWRKRREEDAARVTAAALEEAIRFDVERLEGRKAEEVKVLVEQNEAGLAVRQVTVLLSDPRGEPKEQNGTAARFGPIADVEAVAPVIIDLRSRRTGEASGESDGGVRAADPETGYRIGSLIAAKYDVPAESVTVLEIVNGDHGGG